MLNPEGERQPLQKTKTEKAKIYNDTWNSCCMTLDKRATLFFTQLIISLLIMVFCIYQLVHLTDCNSQQTYISMLTLVVGLWLPQPQMIQ
jgi:hypothetical protein